MDFLLLVAIAWATARGLDGITGDVKAKRAGGPGDRKVRAAKAKNPRPAVDGAIAAAAVPKVAKTGAATARLAAAGAANAAAWRSAFTSGFRQEYDRARAEAARQLRERAGTAAAPAAGPSEGAGDEPAPGSATADPAVPAPATPTDSTPGHAPSPGPTSSPTPPAGRRLTLVPRPAPTPGDPMPPSTTIPEIRTLDGLLAALAMVNAMCLMRAEEAQAIADDDKTLANRLDQLEADLADLDVDPATRTEIADLRESIQAQAKAATEYSTAAFEAADLAKATVEVARKGHMGIAEAVQSSPIEQAAKAGYYER